MTRWIEQYGDDSDLVACRFDPACQRLLTLRAAWDDSEGGSISIFSHGSHSQPVLELEFDRDNEDVYQDFRDRVWKEEGSNWFVIADDFANWEEKYLEALDL